MAKKRRNREERRRETHRQEARRRQELKKERRDDLLGLARELVGTWAVQIQTNESDCIMRFIESVWHDQVFIRGQEGGYRYSDRTGRFEPMNRELTFEPLPTVDWPFLVRLKRDMETLLDLLIRHDLGLVLRASPVNSSVEQKQATLSKVGEAYFVDGWIKLIKPLRQDATLWTDDGAFFVDLADLYSQCAPVWCRALALPRDLADLCLHYMFPSGQDIHRDYELNNLHGEADLYEQ